MIGLPYLSDNFWPLTGGLITASILLAVFYLMVWILRPTSQARAIFKTLPVALLVPLGGDWALIIALTLCALGDYFLAFDDDRRFLPGVISFAAAHIAFAVNFLRFWDNDWGNLTRLGNEKLIIGVVVLAVLYAIYLYRKAGALRFAVVAYIPFILVFFITAATLPGYGPMEYVHLGVLLFVISDAILALNMFVVDKAKWTHPATRILVWITYYPAVLYITLGMAVMVHK